MGKKSPEDRENRVRFVLPWEVFIEYDAFALMVRLCIAWHKIQYVRDVKRCFMARSNFAEERQMNDIGIITINRPSIALIRNHQLPRCENEADCLKRQKNRTKELSSFI